MTVKSLKVCTEEWKALPWKKFQKTLFNLQHRIYKAAQKGDTNLLKKLQSLLIGSSCSKYLSVREVTKCSTNKSMFGMTHSILLDARKKLLLVEKLDSIQILKQQRLDFSLLKKTRVNSLEYSVLILQDKAIQCLIKYALEPVYEFSSYRTYNSYHIKENFELKIQRFKWQNLKDSNANVFELNIKSRLYEIYREKLLSLITAPLIVKKYLRSFLKHEFSKEKELIYIKRKTRNLISPLLYNLFTLVIKEFYTEIIENRVIEQKEIFSGNSILFRFILDEFQYHLFQKRRAFLNFRNLNKDTTKRRLKYLKNNLNFLGWPLKIKGKNKNNHFSNSQDINKIIKAAVKAKIKDSRYNLKTRIQRVTSIYNNCWKLYRFCKIRQLKNTFRSLRAWSYRFIRKNTNSSKEQTSHLINSIFNQY